MRVRYVLAALILAAFVVQDGAAQSGVKSGLDQSLFDQAVRPQDDLFRHVNGGWLAKTPLPADKPVVGTFYDLRDRAEANVHVIVEELSAESNKKPGSPAQEVGDLFGSFMDEKAIEARGGSPLTSRLAEIDAVKNTKDLAALMGKLSLVGIGGPVDDGSAQDKTDPTMMALYVEQSALALPDRDYYLEDNPQFAGVRAKYTSYLETMFTLAHRPDPAAAAKSVLALETSLAKIQWTSVENRDAVKTYNTYTPAKLAADAPGFDWAAWGHPQKLDGVKQWIIEQPSYFTSFAAMVPTVPLDTWKAWLSAEVITHEAPYLSNSFYDPYFDFFGRTLTGQQVPRDRWKRGVQLVNGAVGEAVGQIYVTKYFSPDSKARMQALVANLLEAYRRSISTLDWMTPATRQQALAKLAKITPKIGYPDKWRDYRALVIKPDDPVGNAERAATFTAEHELAKIGHPVDHEEWDPDTTPQTVNAFYDPSANDITFPAAILQAPFFDPTADVASNYGAIGAIIGHEVGHAFDDQGRKYDGNGKLHDWWAPSDAAEFEKRAKLLADQFSAYTILPGVHVNGELTLGENIGDLGGLSIAYQAWKISLDGKPSPVIDGFTGDERFFFSWAQAWRGKASDAYLQRQVLQDPHAWNEFRANGPVSNMQAFYDAFGVKPGDKLYRDPSLRVRIW